MKRTESGNFAKDNCVFSNEDQPQKEVKSDGVYSKGISRNYGYNDMKKDSFA